MRRATHGLTVNGSIHTEAYDSLYTPQQLMHQRLSLLDGVRRFSWSLWALPPDTGLDEVDFVRWPEAYIQVAGSRERLTVEMRTVGPDGPHHVVLGHGESAKAGGDDLWVEVHWNGCVSRVHPNEVFDADAAAELFIAYLRDGDVDPAISRRSFGS